MALSNFNISSIIIKDRRQQLGGFQKVAKKVERYKRAADRAEIYEYRGGAVSHGRYQSACIYDTLASLP